MHSVLMNSKSPHPKVRGCHGVTFANAIFETKTKCMTDELQLVFKKSKVVFK